MRKVLNIFTIAFKSILKNKGRNDNVFGKWL